MVTTKIFTEPPVCKKEILRYAGCKDMADQNLESLLEGCLKETLPKLSYKVCYDKFPLKITDSVCDFDCMKVSSNDLAKNLNGCEEVLIFAATIGIEIDRLIARYGRISPAKAVMLQAIGAERIESLCDAFCKSVHEELSEGLILRPRFSPGYGDLPLQIQEDIFQVLDCSKKIGVSLNDSLLMTPSKSVTAFVGFSKECAMNTHGCAECKKIDCIYRKDIEIEGFR